MGNIRMTSLDNNRVVASHDCPTCVKRRIKCDRSEPACIKCASRHLKCPGFKAVYLKWDQGIASRGRFAGKSAPDTTAKTSVIGSQNDANHRRDHYCRQLQLQRQRQRQLLSQAESSSTPRASSEDAQTVEGSDVQPDTDRRIRGSFLSSSIFQTLIHHFCTKAISRLTWIDQPSHPWRTIVLNLLPNSTCVQLSVGCLAAAHLSMAPNIPSSQSGSLYNIYSSLRDESMRLLTGKMQDQMQALTGPTCGPLPEIETLASMLALCIAEVLVPGSLNWKIHLRACRAVIDRQQVADWQEAATDPVLKFLLKEISDLEVFVGTTTFEEETMTSSSVMSLQSSNTVSGWAFTSLIFKITALERKRHCVRQAKKGDVPLRAVDMKVWHRRVEDAYKTTMACPRLLVASQTRTLKECFEALTRTYRNATLLYSYQAFATEDERANVVEQLVHELLEDVHLIVTGPTDDLFHDLFFPLFIAGVESVYNRHRQLKIEKLFTQSLSRSGIWCNYSALQFLRTFWSPPASLEQHANWIHFARANLSTVGTFIVL